MLSTVTWVMAMSFLIVTPHFSSLRTPRTNERRASRHNPTNIFISRIVARPSLYEHGQVCFGSKTSKAQSEYMFSGLSPIATDARTFWIGSLSRVEPGNFTPSPSQNRT
jgi:hypothetical protein